MRILQTQSPEDIRRIMQEIKVDAYGIRIMLPKALYYLFRINGLSNIAANILKQEMLSLGGDAAVARRALTGKAKKTDCLAMGTQAQFLRLQEKLSQQPFGLKVIAADLAKAPSNYQRKDFILPLGKYKLRLGRRTRIMGVLNLTPDSFSGDGLYSSLVARRSSLVEEVVNFAQNLVHDGADIIDVGGESTRPGAKAVPVREELARVIPAVRALSKKIKVPISIDTYKPEVTRQALDNGAVLVNDITGLRNPKMAKIIAKYKAGVVIMHMQGDPRTMQKNPHYKSLMAEVIAYLEKGIVTALEAGIDKDKIIIDPGIGFGKTLQDNLEILKRLSEFKILGRPILVGPSRKSFLGKILNLPPQERVFGTVSACILAAKNGASIVRVHDVGEVAQALKVFEAIDR